MQGRAGIWPIARLATLALLLAVAVAAPARAGGWNTQGGAAIGGTDPVAYFVEQRAVPGDPAISLEWDGATWYFASEANRAAFAAAPGKYAPQYGGYCAYGVAQGATPTIVPEAWTIKDGKLYLNYSLGVRQRWNVDRDRYIEQADARWPELKPE
jgi:YHS domain-containing protein